MAEDIPPFDRVGPEALRDPGGSPPAGRAVLIVEDHPLFAEALELTLSGVPGLRRQRRVGTLAAALEAVADRETAPDTVLLDLGLPDTQGLEGLARLRVAAPLARILVVTSLADMRLAAAALAAGADGVVTKDVTRDRLAAALHAVWAGERVAPPDLAQARGAGGSEGAEAARRLAALTPQQARILELVCAGMLNKQIAFELDIAETTVKAHISAILRKLGVQSRTQAVLVARKARFDAIAPEAAPGAHASAADPRG